MSEPTHDDHGPQQPALWILGSADADELFAAQREVLGGRVWKSPASDDEAWLAAAEQELERASHLIAATDVAPQVLQLAARRPELVISVQLVDPQFDTDDADLRDVMRQISAPTLVLAAAPQPDTTFAVAQAVAGTVDNGVMVLIDGHDAPVHATASSLVTEWIWPFMEIAEGLLELGQFARPNEMEE